MAAAPNVTVVVAEELAACQRDDALHRAGHSGDDGATDEQIGPHLTAAGVAIGAASRSALPLAPWSAAGRSAPELSWSRLVT